MKPHGVQRDQGSPGSTLGIARRAGGGGSVFATLVPLWVKSGSHRSNPDIAMRADAMLEKGDLDGYAVWKRILRAVEELQGTMPGARVH